MRKASFTDMQCSIAQSLEIIGEWWTLLILRDAFLGVRRFDDFVERLGISRNVLTTRLDTLVEAGVFERRPYDEARGPLRLRPDREGPSAVAGDDRRSGSGVTSGSLGAGNEPVLLEHRDRGHLTTVRMTCDVCGEVLDGRSVRAVAGPGATAASPLPAPSEPAVSAVRRRRGRRAD